MKHETVASGFEFHYETQNLAPFGAGVGSTYFGYLQALSKL